MFTDLKLDNVLFGSGHDDADIDALLLDEPLAVDGEFELYGKRYPIMRSQPLRHKFPWDASRHLTELLSVYLTDFSHGPFSSHVIANCFYGSSYSSPLTLLRIASMVHVTLHQRSKSIRYTLQWKSARMLFVLQRLF
jgi:hypothetical protein